MQKSPHLLYMEEKTIFSPLPHILSPALPHGHSPMLRINWVLMPNTCLKGKEEQTVLENRTAKWEQQSWIHERELQRHILLAGHSERTRDIKERMGQNQLKKTTFRQEEKFFAMIVPMGRSRLLTEVAEYQSLEIFRTWQDKGQYDHTLRLDLTPELVLLWEGTEWD